MLKSSFLFGITMPMINRIIPTILNVGICSPSSKAAKLIVKMGSNEQKIPA